MSRLIVIGAITILMIGRVANADWWDSLTETVSDGLTGAAGWVKETASPAVREKFNEYKENLQDPETHRSIREWISEKASVASEFAKTEVLPELKKIYEAATSDEAKEKKVEEDLK